MADDAKERVDDLPSCQRADTVPTTQRQPDKIYFQDLPDALIVTNLDECVFDDVNCKVGIAQFNLRCV